MYFQYNGYLIHLVRRANARRLSMTAHKGKDSLTLTLPPWAGRREIQEFLEDNEEWIRAHAVRMDAWHPSYLPGENHPCLGERVTLGERGVPSGKAFIRWRAERLTELICHLLPQWEKRMGVRVHELRFRDTKSQWGSCQHATATVTLAANLCKVPPECVEYILVHELCHLHHPDHSPAFHAEMTALLPDWKERRERLNRFDLQAYPPET